MKFKELLKERVKERVDEATSSSGAYQAGATNHARWTPAGQTRKLTVPQLSGYFQVEEPEAEDPIPTEDVPEGPDVDMKRALNYKHNNKVRREDDGELTASGMPGDAYASPAEYVGAHEGEAENEATA
jgi:hypothetical protein